MSMDTDRIEADVNESRTRLNDTLNQLGSKLSPGQMLDEVMGLAQGQAGEFAGKLGRQVKNNPMPALLIGAGLAMLMMNKGAGHASGFDEHDWHSERRYRSLEEARWSTPRQTNESDDDYESRLHDVYGKALDLKQRAGEAAHEFKARIGQTVDGVRDAAHSARERMGQSFSATTSYVAGKAHNLGERAGDLRHDAMNFYSDNPLSLGAIALALGALLGSTAPLSDLERQKLQGVANKATETGADLAQRGAQMVEEKLGPVH